MFKLGTRKVDPNQGIQIDRCHAIRRKIIIPRNQNNRRSRVVMHKIHVIFISVRNSVSKRCTMFPRALLITHTLARSQARLWYPIRYFTTQPEQPSKSWLTQKIESSPAARKWFLTIVKGLGYDSPKQLAGRRAFVLYERVVALTPDTNVTFWQKGAEVCLALNP